MKIKLNKENQTKLKIYKLHLDENKCRKWFTYSKDKSDLCINCGKTHREHYV